MTETKRDLTDDETSALMRLILIEHTRLAQLAKKRSLSPAVKDAVETDLATLVEIVKALGIPSKMLNPDHPALNV